MINVTEILAELCPNDSWSVVGEPQTESEYVESVIWNSEAPQPTWDELVAEWDAIKYKIDYDKVSAQRKFAYTQEADPIFFQWQRGEKTQQEWLDAVAAINDRYPYPAE